MLDLLDFVRFSQSLCGGWENLTNKMFNNLIIQTMKARNFFIGKTIGKGKDEKPRKLFFLFEKGANEDEITQPAEFNALKGGEPDFKEISKILVKVYKTQSFFDNTNFAQTAFTVSNLQAEMIIVETDSCLKFIKPLSVDEFELFYNEYFVRGKYC